MRKWRDKVKSVKAWKVDRRIHGSRKVRRRCLTKGKKVCLAACLTPPSFVSLHLRSVSCVIKSGELLSSRMSENVGTPPRIQEDDEATVHHVVVVVVVVVLERSSLVVFFFFVVTFSNVVRRDHLRAARVFDKPVKARPRICLPLAFVTLLVLWLDSELTWKKGPRWYPEQTVRVCPGSTRRTPLSVTVACSPTANTPSCLLARS